MRYWHPAVERAMTIREVMQRAMSGEYRWYSVAETLGMDVRSLRRWWHRYERFEYGSLLERRQGPPPAHRAHHCRR